MSTTSLKTTTSAAALIATALSIGTSAALADDAKIKSISYSADAAGMTLHVGSTDGKTWNTFKAGNLHFNAKFKVDTSWPGYVEYVGIALGHCGGAQCRSMPKVWASSIAQRDVDRSVSLFFPSSLIPIGKGGIPVIPDGSEILSKCNQHLTADGPTKKHTFTHELWTTLVVQTDKAVLNDNVITEVTEGMPFPVDVDATRSDKVTVNVVCDPIIKSPTDGLATVEPDFAVKDVAIRLLTTANHPVSPNPGTKCQVSTARVRVATSKAGPVKFKLWTKIGDKPMQSEFVEAWSSFSGPGKFEAVIDRKINVDKTSQIQVMAEDLTNPIGQSTGWKLGQINCTGAGGGGLAAPQGGGNPDNDSIIPSLKVIGHLGLGEKPGAGPNKPRDATVVARLWSNKAGPTSYKLTCTGGHEWTGSVDTVLVSPGKYQGHVLKTVHIDRTTQLACAIRSTSMSGNPVVALASKQYLVVQRNPDIKGPITLTAPSRPTHDAKPKDLPKRATPVTERPKLRIIPTQRATIDTKRGI
jgi:hypothetical protein